MEEEWWFLGYGIYGGYMAKKVFQGRSRVIAAKVIRECVDTQRVGREIWVALKQDIDRWPLSMLLGRMVKEGYLQVVAGEDDVEPGHSLRKAYQATRDGVEESKKAMVPDTAVEGLLEKVRDRGGKWVKIPRGTSHHFRDVPGYETSMFARWVGDE